MCRKCNVHRIYGVIAHYFTMTFCQILFETYSNFVECQCIFISVVPIGKICNDNCTLYVIGLGYIARLSGSTLLLAVD